MRRHHWNLVRVEVPVQLDCFVYHFASQLTFRYFLSLWFNSIWTLSLVDRGRCHNFGVFRARYRPFTFLLLDHFGICCLVTLLSDTHNILMVGLILRHWNLSVAGFIIYRSLIRSTHSSRGLATDRTDMVVCHHKIACPLAFINLSGPKVGFRIFWKQVVLVTWRCLLLDTCLSRCLLAWNLDWNIRIHRLSGISGTLSTIWICLLLELVLVEI